MMRKAYLIILCLGMLAWSVGSFGEVVDKWVNDDAPDNSGPGTQLQPWKTITHALSQITDATANKLYIIHVEGGTYSTSSNGEGFPLTMVSFVSIEGVKSDGEIPIIDGGGLNNVINCDGKAGVKLKNLLIYNGSNSGNGGGIYCRNSQLEIDHCIFLDNKADLGGGIYFKNCEGGNSPEIKTSIFIGNSRINHYSNPQSNDGRAIYCESSDPHLTDCFFINQCSISDCASFQNLAVYGDQNSTITSEGCLSWNNGVEPQLLKMGVNLNNKIFDKILKIDYTKKK